MSKANYFIGLFCAYTCKHLACEATLEMTAKDLGSYCEVIVIIVYPCNPSQFTLATMPLITTFFWQAKNSNHKYWRRLLSPIQLLKAQQPCLKNKEESHVYWYHVRCFYQHRFVFLL